MVQHIAAKAAYSVGRPNRQPLSQYFRLVMFDDGRCGNRVTVLDVLDDRPDFWVTFLGDSFNEDVDYSAAG
ncbi:hypothetical protein ARTHRO8AJ_40154 [Arthrobacter sp. 8AJ]|nr:hypothetical protein ARTHRO8AJ_40154 [Arthrobacter sp. 8AJ]